MEKKFKIDKNTYLLYEFLSFFNYYHFEDNKIKEKIDNLKQYIDKKYILKILDLKILWMNIYLMYLYWMIRKE